MKEVQFPKSVPRRLSLHTNQYRISLKESENKQGVVKVQYQSTDDHTGKLSAAKFLQL